MIVVENLVTALHILVALSLIGLVLIQDSKGGGALGIGGGGSNSLLGATGAQTLAAKMTRVTAIFFAVTCLILTYMSSQRHKSVLDNVGVVSTPTAPPAEASPPNPAPEATTNPEKPAEAPKQ